MYTVFVNHRDNTCCNLPARHIGIGRHHTFLQSHHRLFIRDYNSGSVHFPHAHTKALTNFEFLFQISFNDYISCMKGWTYSGYIIAYIDNQSEIWMGVRVIREKFVSKKVNLGRIKDINGIKEVV